MYKQKQGRSEFPKTGRGITSKLAGPDPTTNGDINITKTTSKSVAAKIKAKERRDKKIENQRNEHKRVKLPGTGSSSAGRVKLPGTGKSGAKRSKF